MVLSLVLVGITCIYLHSVAQKYVWLILGCVKVCKIQYLVILPSSLLVCGKLIQ